MKTGAALFLSAPRLRGRRGGLVILYLSEPTLRPDGAEIRLLSGRTLVHCRTMASEQQTLVEAEVERPSNVVRLANAGESVPDPRLTNFIRLLARQAARDYYEQSRRDGEQRGR